MVFLDQFPYLRRHSCPVEAHHEKLTHLPANSHVISSGGQHDASTAGLPIKVLPNGIQSDVLDSHLGHLRSEGRDLVAMSQDLILNAGRVFRTQRVTYN